MRIFTIFTFFSLIFIAGLATTWFSKTIYNEGINHQLAFIEQHSGQQRFSFERDITQSGFFAFSDRIVVHFEDPEASAGGPVAITLRNQCRVFPFYVACDVRFDIDPALASQIDAFLPNMGQLPYQLKTSVNVLSSTFNSSFTTQTHRIEGQDYVVTLKPVTVTGSASLDMDELQTRMEWQGADWQTTSVSGKVTGVKLSANRDKQGRDFYLGSSRISLAQFEINLKQIRYTGKDLTVQSNTDVLSPQSYGFNQRIEQAALVMHNDRQVSLKAFLLDVSVNGLSSNAMVQMNSTGSLSDIQEQDMASIINALGERTLIIPLDALSAELNGKKVAASGKVSVAPFNFTDLHQGTFRKGLNGSFTVNLEAGVASEMPGLQPMLDALLSEGFISMDETGNIAGSLVVDKGKVTANGRVLPI